LHQVKKTEKHDYNTLALIEEKRNNKKQDFIQQEFSYFSISPKAHLASFSWKNSDSLVVNHHSRYEKIMPNRYTSS
jgi:hypothetical protein